MKFKKESGKNMLYDIESIITRKIKGNKKYYLIKWEGYPITDCSWEPLSHLSNLADVVKDFDRNYPSSIDQKALHQFKIEYKKYKNEKRKKKKNYQKNLLNYNKIIIDLKSLEFNMIEEGTLDDEININKIENKTDDNTFCEKTENENENIEKISNDCSICIKDIKDDGNNKLIEPVLIW